MKVIYSIIRMMCVLFLSCSSLQQQWGTHICAAAVFTTVRYAQLPDRHRPARCGSSVVVVDNDPGRTAALGHHLLGQLVGAVQASERLVAPRVQIQGLAAEVVLALAVAVDVGRGVVDAPGPVVQQYLALL